MWLQPENSFEWTLNLNVSKERRKKKNKNERWQLDDEMLMRIWRYTRQHTSQCTYNNNNDVVVFVTFIPLYFLFLCLAICCVWVKVMSVHIASMVNTFLMRTLRMAGIVYLCRYSTVWKARRKQTNPFFIWHFSNK